MLQTFRLMIVPAALGLVLAAAPVLAEDHGAPKTMPPDATTVMDEAAEAEDKAAEAIEMKKVAKEKALEAQGKEQVEEEISGAK